MKKYKPKFLEEINHKGKIYLYIGKIGRNLMGEGLHIIVSQKTKKPIQINGDFTNPNN